MTYSVFQDYNEAAAVARFHARETKHAHGIEKWRDYGIGPWGSRVFMIPNDPAKRFGFEARCEAVSPTDPLSTRDIEILIRLKLMKDTAVP